MRSNECFRRVGSPWFAFGGPSYWKRSQKEGLFSESRRVRSIRLLGVRSLLRWRQCRRWFCRAVCWVGSATWGGRGADSLLRHFPHLQAVVFHEFLDLTRVIRAGANSRSPNHVPGGAVDVLVRVLDLILDRSLLSANRGDQTGPRGCGVFTHGREAFPGCCNLSNYDPRCRGLR